MTDDLIERLRDLRERFIFQGGSPFAEKLANEIASLRAEFKTVEAFYRLTLKQRDAAWREIEQRQADIEALRLWAEEAVEYVGRMTWSPSIEREGRALLARTATKENTA